MDEMNEIPAPEAMTFDQLLAEHQQTFAQLCAAQEREAALRAAIERIGQLIGSGLDRAMRNEVRRALEAQ